VGKAVSKKQTKRKATEVEDKAKKNLDSERDELKESEIIYIKEKAPTAKKQKAKNIIETVVPKRNIYLATKRV
jgi:hypothetical protein